MELSPNDSQPVSPPTSAQVCPPDCKFDTDRTRAHLLRHIRAGIPTRITQDEVGLMPMRGDFVDPGLRSAFAQKVRKGEPIIFMPNTVCDKPEWTSRVGVHKSYVFGILPCGSKVCVILDGIEVNFEVRVPAEITDDAFTAVLRTQLASSSVNYIGMKTVMLTPLRQFHTEPVAYKRLVFNTTMDRRKCMDVVANMSVMRTSAGKPALETAADDTGVGNFYFSKAAREHRFATADWNRLDKYIVAPNVTTNCAYTLRTDVRNYKRLRADRKTALARGPLGPILDRDPTMIVSWDIETWSPVQNGVVPTAADTGFVIKMICAAYFPQHSDAPYMGVCCVMHDTPARAGVGVTVVCQTERDVLDTHTLIWGKMAPDISVATNGSNFDWPLVREKMRRLGMLVLLKSRMSSLPLQTRGNGADTEASVHRWSFLTEKIKMDATTDAHLDTVANFPGLLDTDLTPTFTKMYPRNEVRRAASLNFFLESNGLESKADMPYKRMFKIFERATALEQANPVCHCVTNAPATCPLCAECVREIDCRAMSDELYSTERLDDPAKCCACTKRPRNLVDMADVAYYCIIDCVRPQQLYVKRMIVADKRELSTTSYVTLFDSFYRADGMKVANIIGAYAHKRSMAFSNANRNVSEADKDFYPGAWVFPPNRGLHSDGWIDITTQDGVRKRVRCRPTTGLDFASLYPSLMMTYNLSPDKVVYTREEADRLAALGYSIHHVKPFQFERGSKKGAAGNRKLTTEGWIVRHNGIIKTGRDTRVVTGYTKFLAAQINRKPVMVDGAPLRWPADQPAPTIPSGANVIAEYDPIYDRAPLPGECMGIFPFVVKKIFDKRVPIKKEFLYWQGLEETMSEAGQKTVEVTLPDGTVITLDYDHDVCFTMNKVDAKQKALKVLANTFYGKSGEFRASIYELLVAAGITCAGQENIKRVARFVESLGYVVHYGDTDSVYISCPDSLFAKCDAVYFAEMERLEKKYAGVENVPLPAPNTPEAEYKAERIAARTVWWTEQVKLTQKDINILKVRVGEMLMADNGTRSLNLAYEEVGMPSAYCGKKKYFMTPHIDKVNFHPKKPFIKGIDIVKQGQAPITKILGESFIREVLSVENERSMMEVCLEKVDKFSSMMHDTRMFAQSARYKPTVKNVPVLLFVARMRTMHQRFVDLGDHVMAALYEPPEPGDKFEYVVVQKDQRFTIAGCKIALGKGDRMEFLRVFDASQSCAEPMRLDFAHYMEKAIVGLFARFISYGADFQPPVGKYNVMDKEQYTLFDKECLKGATQFLLARNTHGVDKKELTQLGKDYRAIYAHAAKRMRADLVAKLGNLSVVIYELRSWAQDGGGIATNMVKQAVNWSKQFATRDPANTVVDHYRRSREDPNIFTLRAFYNTPGGIGRSRAKACDAQEAAIMERMYKIARPIADLLARYDADVVAIIDDMRRARSRTEIVLDDETLDELHAFDDYELEIMREMYDCMISLAAVNSTRDRALENMEAIECARAKTANGPLTPKSRAGEAK